MIAEMDLNRGRSVGIESLRDTIAELRGQAGVTEKNFKDSWLNKIKLSKEVIPAGWYAPPPDGVSVLSATPDNSDRLNYTSLRSPENWPSDRQIEWKNAIMMAYCCPIDRKSGLAGDVAVTMYFGKEKKIIDYYHKAKSVYEELLHSISLKDTSSEVVERADELFRKNGLKSYVSSITDKASYNIGHTIPKLDPHLLRDEVSELQREECRLQRRFLNYVDEWQIAGDKQFSIEPQLRSEMDETLPKLTFHSIVYVRGSKLLIPADAEDLYFGGRI